MRRWLRLVVLILVLAAGLAGPAAARVSREARASPASLCEAAAQRAAAESGVPYDILAAVSLTETGRRQGGAVRPWAWSVNAEGAGTWFDDRASALALAEERIRAGRTNVDIGCFQLNYRWHGQAFASVEQMFDPLANARYAARFLTQLFGEMGDWRAAAGAFHSRNPAHATRYLARFDDLRALVRDGGGPGPETYNRFLADRAIATAGSGEPPLLILAGETPYDPAAYARGPIDIALDSGAVLGGDGLPYAAPDDGGALEALLAGDGMAGEPRRVRVRRQLTLLGAEPGTEAAAAAGSLAPLGTPARPLLAAPSGSSPLLLRTASAADSSLW